MSRWENILTEISGRGGGVLAHGVRMTHVKGSKPGENNCQIRLGVDVLRKLRWQSGDKIGLKCDRQSREFLLYRNNKPAYKEKVYSLVFNGGSVKKKFLGAECSAAIQINPKAILDSGIAAILNGMCQRECEPHWRDETDGLVVSMVAE